MNPKEIAKKWFRQGVHELEMAEKNLEIGGYDVASFLAHQAVEKLLKAGFASEGKEIPRTHYLDELAKGLQLPEELYEAVVELTPDYTFSRYPDASSGVPYEQYTEQMAREKVEIAKRVLSYFEARWGRP